MPNHLIQEKSPYLKQHAHNPVDWYPWGEEAFSRAAEEHKPVFLSIGYATCHWCHVMAHESFEDQGIATLLNTHFIAIKVDREERPDIDSVYMAACQHMTGQGGWPLTIIMTPDKKPFFAGTYFPRTSRSGMMGLSELLEKVIRLWRDERGTLVTAAEQLTDVLLKNHDAITEGIADTSLLTEGYHELALSFDRVNGGFGRAPKFPTPSTLLFLLRYGKRTGEPHALRMVEQTLDAIRCGGIHDHIGGGFHRYSTDARWHVPHFEKMLYDQAQLLMAFTEAWQITKKPVYQDTSEDIFRYVTGNLTSPEGAFFSAEDADSIDGEGAFYLWTKKEVEDILGPDDGLFTVELFGISSEGNFISPDTGPGKNILFLTQKSLTSPEKQARFESVRKKLLAQRQERTRPLRDEKILTDWNGLMIVGLAQAYRAFDNCDYLRAAETAMRFILKHLRMPDGGLLHRYCDGEADIVAFADDYAFTIRALLELYEASFDPVWLEEALALHGYLGNHFSDKKDAGYFSCSDDGDALIVRKKEIYDGAIPSGNSVILGNLVLLGHLTGDPKFEEEASRLSDHFAGIVRASPSGYTTYLSGLDYLIGPASDIVIAGNGTDRCVQEMIRLIRDTYLPTMTVHFRADPGGSDRLDELAPFTRTMTAYGGNATAYVCSGHTCSMPITTIEVLLEQLGKKKE